MSEKLTAEQIIKAFENCELEKATLYLYNTKEEKVVFIPTVEIYELITRLCSEKEELVGNIDRLKRFKAYFDDLYGCDLEVLGWHENGYAISFDEFYDSAMNEMESTKQKECRGCVHYSACKGTYYTAKGDDGLLHDFDGELYADSGCEDYKKVVGDKNNG